LIAKISQPITARRDSASAFPRFLCLAATSVYFRNSSHLPYTGFRIHTRHTDSSHRRVTEKATCRLGSGWRVWAQRLSSYVSPYQPTTWSTHISHTTVLTDMHTGPRSTRCTAKIGRRSWRTRTRFLQRWFRAKDDTAGSCAHTRDAVRHCSSSYKPRTCADMSAVREASPRNSSGKSTAPSCC
jgi:hypothetical protein